MVLRYLDTAIGFAVVMLLLSLLVTALVQTAVAFLNLRGSNLHWGLTNLLRQIDPSLPQAISKEIAEKVLTHPAVASTGFLVRRRRAMAIRVEELFRVIEQLRALGAAPGEKPLGAAALAELRRLGGEPLMDAARIDQLATGIAKVVPAQAAVLRAWMTETLAAPTKIIAGVNDWFNTIMDRTTQRFTMYTRWLSVIAAVLVTAALRLDTPGVLNRIWSNGALREQLVGAAPEALRVADTVRVYERSQQTLATRAIGALREEHTDTALQRILATAPPELGSSQEGAAWLSHALAGRRDSTTLVSAFRGRMATESDSLLTRFADASKRVRVVLADPAVGIFQVPLPPLGSYWYDLDHLVRGLISVVLLGLGAPFWYNALKGMANLRPHIAEKVADEAKSKRE
jgi:hypothetical protein